MRHFLLLLCACGGMTAVDAGEPPDAGDAGVKPGILLYVSYSVDVRTNGSCTGIKTCNFARDSGVGLPDLYADAGCIVIEERAAGPQWERVVSVDCRPVCGWDGGAEWSKPCCRSTPYANPLACGWTTTP